MDDGHRELIRPPAWMWLVGFVLAVTLAVELAVLTQSLVGAVSGVVLCALVGAGLEAWALEVRVCAGELRAGRARIPLGALGPVRALTGDELRARMGRDADPAAHLAMRPWIRTAVEVAVRDEADPTPYWLVGTRRPDALLAALGMPSA